MVTSLEQTTCTLLDTSALSIHTTTTKGGVAWRLTGLHRVGTALTAGMAVLARARGEGARPEKATVDLPPQNNTASTRHVPHEAERRDSPHVYDTQTEHLQWK